MFLYKINPSGVKNNMSFRSLVSGKLPGYRQVSPNFRYLLRNCKILPLRVNEVELFGRDIVVENEDFIDKNFSTTN